MTTRARSKRLAKRIVAIIVGVVSLASFAPAWAAPDDQPEKKLLEEGRKLMENPATLAEGCRKLEESLKIAVRGDTLLNLAYCHEKMGKTATAWAEYGQAVPEGEKVKFSEAIQLAIKRREALAAMLSMLTVEVSAEMAKLEGFSLEVNGAPWPEDKRNTPVPLDPGPLEIKATAKGYKPFAASVELGTEKDRKTVTVALKREPPPAARPTPPPAPKPPAVKTSKPLWPWILGGAGVGLVGASIGFVLDQRAAASELDDTCGPTRGCPAGYDFNPARSREVRDHYLFIGLGAAGLLALGGAGVGFALGPKEQPTATASVILSPTSIVLRGEL